MSNVEGKPTPSVDGTHYPGPVAESSQSLQLIDTADPARSSAAGRDDRVSAISNEEVAPLFEEQAPERADPGRLIEAVEVPAPGSELVDNDPAAPTIDGDFEENSAVGAPLPPLASEFGPLIEAVEAQVRGIRQELDLARPFVSAVSAGTLSETGGVRRPDLAMKSELVPLIEAFEAQVGEIRHQLGLTKPVVATTPLNAADGNEHSNDRRPSPAMRGELGPLVEAFGAQIQVMRKELGLTEPGVEKFRLSPPLPRASLPYRSSPLREKPVGGSALGFGRDARSRPWVIGLAVFFMVAAIGGWLAWNQRLPTQDVASPIASRSASSESPPSTPVPIASPPAESSQPATASTLPLRDVPANGASDSAASAPAVGPRFPPRDPVPTRSSDAPRDSVTGATPAAPPENRASIGITSATPASELSPPPASPEAAGVNAPIVGLPADTSSGRDVFGTPDASPPAAGIAASPGAEANVSSALITRPAAVLTRTQPRVPIEALSGEMSAVVELQVNVNSTGRPIEVRAVSGPSALRAPAEDTVRRWTFSPALQGGRPVDGALRVALTFGPSVRDMRFRRRSP